MDGIKNYLTDMDGVILQGSTLLPGAAEFVQRLRAREIPFLILTNMLRSVRGIFLPMQPCLLIPRESGLLIFGSTPSVFQVQSCH